jgi:hypothetical protein
MPLELVWHNPDPPAKVASKVRRVQWDQNGAVHEVSNDFLEKSWR